MIERPIIFSGPMVRAILEGRKTQTRRVIKPQPTVDHYNGLTCGEHHFSTLSNIDNDLAKAGQHTFRKCPYGAPGDMLWVRETYRANKSWDSSPPSAINHECVIGYRATPKDRRSDVQYPGKWRPSIHMPRWASRITLEVTGVRVEQVQDVDWEDAVAEGMLGTEDAIDDFVDLWDSINAKRGHGWDTNPWVWVVEFEVCNG